MAHIRHAAIVVEDLERSIAFYVRVFGWQILAQKTEEGSYIDALLGLTGAKIQWAKIGSKENDVLLELIHYHSHPTRATAPPPYQQGCSHIAITVDDINTTLLMLRANGGYADTPVSNPENTVLVTYARDPEGVILEIVEEK